MVTSERPAMPVGGVGGARAVGGARGRRAGGPADAGRGRPLPPSALELLRRSDEELLAAQLAQEVHDRFRHAHLAALRAAAAVLPEGPTRRRTRPRPVWEQLSEVAPELAGWAAFFADGAAVRAAVEAGRTDAVSFDRAERTLAAAEDFQDVVRERWGLPLVLLGLGAPRAS